ncbi:MAG TPA: hypothetical protein DF699_06045, partial [Phycisphaerales bacterium]|nr:hypothetical protein [Phycisphaerales bacterium]
MNSNTSRMNRTRGGYTLIEVLIVVMI